VLKIVGIDILKERLALTEGAVVFLLLVLVVTLSAGEALPLSLVVKVAVVRLLVLVLHVADFH